MVETSTQFNAMGQVFSNTPADHARSILPLSIPSPMAPSDAVSGSKILRFAKSERLLHWAIAGPFLISFATGAILVLIYNPDPSRPWRQVFAMLHRYSGIALAICPMLALLCGRHDIRIHLYNIKQAWTWIYDDFKWLAFMGLAAISSRFVLPEQGKFNAAEKLNFMVLMSTYPLYVATGFLMWLIPLAVLSWIMHSLMAIMATPLVLGHLYMALVNSDTRPGLEGMISGHVDRQWAKHHYRRWYRKFHEATEQDSINKLSETEFLIPQLPGRLAGLAESIAGSSESSVSDASPVRAEADALCRHDALSVLDTRIPNRRWLEQSSLARNDRPFRGENRIVNRALYVTSMYQLDCRPSDSRNRGPLLKDCVIRLAGMDNRAECRVSSLIRAENGSSGIENHILFDLRPPCFLCLCEKLRKVGNQPALFYESKREIRSGGVTQGMNLRNYLDLRSNIAAGSTLPAVDGSNEILAIRLGIFVATPSSGIAVLSPGQLDPSMLAMHLSAHAAEIHSVSEIRLVTD